MEYDGTASKQLIRFEQTLTAEFTNFNRESTILIATFNVGTLNKIGQISELTVSAIYHNIDTVCVKEHRCHHCEEDMKYYDTGNVWTFVSYLHGKTLPTS